MTIQEIKDAISAKSKFTLGTLSMVRQFKTVIDPTDTTKTVQTPEPWVSHWDNDHRVRITMYEDIMAELKANTSKADLAFKYELVQAHDAVAAYERYVVITPRGVEATF